MDNTEYVAAWDEGLEVGPPLSAAPQARPLPMPAADDYASAWHDEQAGPLEKAVRAAGTAPVTQPQADLARKDKA